MVTKQCYFIRETKEKQGFFLAFQKIFYFCQICRNEGPVGSAVLIALFWRLRQSVLPLPYAANATAGVWLAGIWRKSGHPTWPLVIFLLRLYNKMKYNLLYVMVLKHLREA